MTQISRRRLKPEIEERMFQVFWTAFEKCQTRKQTIEFLQDLLTKTEVVMLTKRLAIALMLYKDYQYREIGEVLKVTPSTIAKVNDWLATKGDGLRHVLERVVEEEGTIKFWESFKGALEELLYTRKPGSNWESLGKLEQQARRRRATNKEVLEKL